MPEIPGMQVLLNENRELMRKYPTAGNSNRVATLNKQLDFAEQAAHGGAI
jgi:hypothetical protein